MLPVEKAVQTAIVELPRFLGGRSPDHLRVEEVLRAPDESGWDVTLSFLEEGTPEPMTEQAELVSRFTGKRPPRKERVLRVVQVDAEGRVTGMRRRPIE